MGNFYQDVIVKDPRFKSPKRVADLAMLEPVTRKLVGNIVADAAAHGMKLIAYETFRSQARQAALFDQGVTKLKTSACTISDLRAIWSKTLAASLRGRVISPSSVNSLINTD